MDNTDTITVADVSSAPAAPPAVESGGWTSIIPMILIFVVFYFLLIRPQEKKRRQQDALISGVKIGEEIVTNSGLFGVVTKINDSDNTIMVRIAKDIEVKVLKNSIADIISRSKKLEDEKDKKQTGGKLATKDATSKKKKK